ncbi:hypothetical protein [Caballeronia glathei]|uniref:hypothetical protein n=1 Tax=Caballeronia glathei TaxID=60547 RepID=UPI001F31F0DE|nr:hypothetical protein [Caballeronia glathei]
MQADWVEFRRRKGANLFAFVATWATAGTYVEFVSDSLPPPQPALLPATTPASEQALRDGPISDTRQAPNSPPAAAGRGHVKTQNYSVFGCPFTLSNALPSQYSAI